MANKKNIKVRDLKPAKDAKGGGGHVTSGGHATSGGHSTSGGGKNPLGHGGGHKHNN